MAQASQGLAQVSQGLAQVFHRFVQDLFDFCLISVSIVRRDIQM